MARNPCGTAASEIRLSVRASGGYRGRVSDDVRVLDDPDRLAYRITVGDREAGVLLYGQRDNRLVFHHTEIDPAFDGQGLGSKLVAGALDDVRARGLVVVPLCPFVRRYIAQHPEYADLVHA